MFDFLRKKSGSDSLDLEGFSFSDEIPMKGKDLVYFGKCHFDGKQYQYPFDIRLLSNLSDNSPHHESCIRLKINVLSSTFVPNNILGSDEFKKLALNFMVFANSYGELVRNRIGDPLRIRSCPALYTKKDKHGGFHYRPSFKEHFEYDQDNMIHIIEPDLSQEIYGSPSYLSCFDSGMLNKSATKFRRRYFDNGTHAGYVIYLNDTMRSKQDVEKFKSALKRTKRDGNFKNLFLYAPGGKKDGLQLIPLSEVQAKDEFVHVKSISAEDVLTAHRVPPALMGVVPSNAAGLGDAEKAARIFYTNEIKPIQTQMLTINDWLGREVVKFNPYEIG